MIADTCKIFPIGRDFFVTVHRVNDYGIGTGLYRDHLEGPVYTDLDNLEERPDGEAAAISVDGSGYSFWYAVPLNVE